MTIEETPRKWWHRLSDGVVSLFSPMQLPRIVRFATAAYAAFWAIYAAILAILFLRAVFAGTVKWDVVGKITPSAAWPVFALVAGLLTAPRLIAIIEARGIAAFGVKVEGPSGMPGSETREPPS